MGRNLRFILAMVFFLPTGPAEAAQTLVTLRPGPALEGFGPRFEPGSRDVSDPEAWGYVSREVKGAIQALESAHGFSATHAYSRVLLGFAADLTQKQIEALRHDPIVESITVTVEVAATSERAPWGVRQIGADPASRSDDAASAALISGVTVYVIDSGIDTKNSGLHVTRHVNFAGGPNTDCNGHGTHVAGIIGARRGDGSVQGVAQGVPLVGVKVVDCSGEGTSATLIKGIDWVAARAQGPSVVNLSLGGGESHALDAAIQAASAQGLFFAIAAGNRATDACLASPSLNGSMSGIVTVGATDAEDQEAGFSNFGGCVDLWAPGVSIESFALGGDGDSRFLSGTSMAAPHVAGAAALYLAENPKASPSQVESALIGTSVVPGTASKDGRTILRLHIGER